MPASTSDRPSVVDAMPRFDSELRVNYCAQMTLTDMDARGGLGGKQHD